MLVGLSGILVLIACLNVLMDERRREVALLRSFGIAKNRLKRMLSLEIGFIGLVSGVVACLFAEVISAIANRGHTRSILVCWVFEPECHMVP